MESVRNLRNIGPVTAALLEQAGIRTDEDLGKIGAMGALLRIRALSSEGCLSMLYGLEGAIRNQRWNCLAPAVKETLRKQFAGLDQKKRGVPR